MLGWLSDAIAWASRAKRSVNRAADTLMAASRGRRVSRARYTVPIPPEPIEPRTSYAPSVVPAETVAISSGVTWWPDSATESRATKEYLLPGPRPRGAYAGHGHRPIRQ